MEQEKKIYESLGNVSQQIKHIAKDQKGFNHSFRGINQVLNELSPLFKKEKILVSKKIVNVKNERYKNEKGKDERWIELHCIYKFTSMLDGSFFEVEGIGEAIDSGDKATGKAISNAYKYVIFEMFNIATEEQKDSDESDADDMKTAKENYNKLKSKEQIEDEKRILLEQKKELEKLGHEYFEISGKKINALKFYNNDVQNNANDIKKLFNFVEKEKEKLLKQNA